MTITIRQKIYLISGLCLIIAILLLGGIVKPLILEVKTTSASVKERNEKLVVLKKTDQEYLKQLENDYSRIKDDLSLIKSGFLDIDQAVDFFIELENIALNTSNRLEIEAKEFPFFNIYLLGNFPNSMKFLGWLENSKYFLDIELIQIKRIGARDLSPEESETISVGDVKTVLQIKNHIKDSEAYENTKNLKSN